MYLFRDDRQYSVYGIAELGPNEKAYNILQYSTISEWQFSTLFYIPKTSDFAISQSTNDDSLKVHFITPGPFVVNYISDQHKLVFHEPIKPARFLHCEEKEEASLMIPFKDLEMIGADQPLLQDHKLEESTKLLVQAPNLVHGDYINFDSMQAAARAVTLREPLHQVGITIRFPDKMIMSMAPCFRRPLSHFLVY
ncbi:hypothetical protein BDD12DRAFT_803981 [Trichophaea hybrida]|nr:hypothetical protein BDD12DRAFT_803981 [Trichophaea hybrida]